MELLQRLVRKLKSAQTAVETQTSVPLTIQPTLAEFLNRCRELEKPRVLEIGTGRADPTRSTRRDAWVPNAAEYLGTDMQSGIDVDIVADVHRLSEIAGEEQFDVIISCSTFEHVKYPHRAAHEAMKALRVGGLLFVQTVQTFPLHDYPYDYFRFSKEALAGLFGTKMGFRLIATDYEFPAAIHSPAIPDNHIFPAFLNVLLFGEKVDKTPDAYIYELDMTSDHG